MKIGFPWLAGVGAAVLMLFALPAAQATAAPIVTATHSHVTATSADSTEGLAMATGDPRHPRQPRLPRTCVVLPATLATSTGEFRGHETLLVEDGVTLYASLNPANNQIPSQFPTNTCGTVSANGGGCYPFITFGGSDAGLMGTRGADGSLGVIDGRGEDTLVGSTQTWWDVAQVADSGGNQNNPILVYGDGANDLTIYQIELENSPMYPSRSSTAAGSRSGECKSTLRRPRATPTASTRSARATSRSRMT
jgi:hypothetical protein